MSVMVSRASALATICIPIRKIRSRLCDNRLFSGHSLMTWQGKLTGKPLRRRVVRPMQSRAIVLYTRSWVWIRHTWRIFSPGAKNSVVSPGLTRIAHARRIFMDALLGIDVGTTGVKAALFAASDGRVLASAFVDYPLLHPQIGWAEQNPADWWQATITAIRTCLVGGVRHNIQPADVRGVGLSGQMHGVVLLDEHMHVLRPCIIWADQPSEAQCRWITERVGAARLIELVSNPALTGFSAPKLLWVRDNEPDIFARAHTMLLPKDYIRWCLTGMVAMEISDAAGTCLLDVKKGIWSQPVLEALELDSALLPPIVAADAVCGTVTDEDAALT